MVNFIYKMEIGVDMFLKGLNFITAVSVSVIHVLYFMFYISSRNRYQEAKT